MLVWRVETHDGRGPYEYDQGSTLTHTGCFPAPRQDAYDMPEGCGSDLYEWIAENFNYARSGFDRERDKEGAAYSCAITQRDALLRAFKVVRPCHAEVFTVTCYEVPPLYVIVLPSQVLYHRSFAVIVSREMYPIDTTAS